MLVWQGVPGACLTEEEVPRRDGLPVLVRTLRPLDGAITVMHATAQDSDITGGLHNAAMPHGITSH
jgi:hypothetical protein